MVIGVSIVLVATMIINEQVTIRSVVRLNGAVTQQQEIAIEIAKIETALRRAQVAGRDLRMGRTTVAVETNIAALNQIVAETNRRLATAKELSRSPDDLARFNLVRKQLDAYVAALSELALTQTRILTLFAKRSEIDNRWLRSANIVVNSTAFSMAPNSSELEYLITTATFSFKDTYAASWRYFVLNEKSQATQIATSSETAVKHLRLLRESAKNTAVVSSVDGLLEIVTEFTTILDETTRAIVAQNDIQERANRAEVEILRLLDEAIRASTTLADFANAAAADGAARAALVRNIVGVTIVVVLLSLSLFISRSIGRPIQRIGKVLLELAQGNKEIPIPYIERGDEVGDNARAAKAFKDNLLRVQHLEMERYESQERASTERKLVMHMLADEFEATIGAIAEAVSLAAIRLEQAASTLTTVATTTLNLAGSVTNAAQEALGNVQSMAAASAELSTASNEIGRAVSEGSKIANDAVTQAANTDRRINELSVAAKRIGEVTKLITDVAEQTNLLALNATIEAARAGNAGRGFSVVAQEVKALANQTSRATDEISGQISSIQSATIDSVAAIEEIRETIDRISTITTAIAATVEEQNATMNEIAYNAQRTSIGTNQIVANISDVNRGTSETGSAAAQVLASAQSLSGESNRLKFEVQKILSSMRAA